MMYAAANGMSNQIYYVASWIHMHSMHSRNTAVGRVVSLSNTPNSQKGTGVLRKFLPTCPDMHSAWDLTVLLALRS